jgi:hypothetical protein
MENFRLTIITQTSALRPGAREREGDLIPKITFSSAL